MTKETKPYTNLSGSSAVTEYVDDTGHKWRMQRKAGQSGIFLYGCVHGAWMWVASMPCYRGKLPQTHGKIRSVHQELVG